MGYLKIDNYRIILDAYEQFSPYCRFNKCSNETHSYPSYKSFPLVMDDGSLTESKTFTLRRNIVQDTTYFKCVGLSGNQLYYISSSGNALKLDDSAVISYSRYGREVIPLLLPPRPIIALDSQGNEYNRAFFNNGGGLQELTGFLF